MLSKRLLKIADLIDGNNVVYDVGSDHALLPCFLILNNKAKKVYAIDNKKGPLDKANKNIKKFNLENKVIPILSNGIDDITNDVDIIVISGMGFYTVKEILENKDLSKYDKIIVQVNKDTPLLREWISNHNYSIIEEEIVKDDFYYEIEVFNAKKACSLKPREIQFGPINLIKRKGVFIEYLKDKREKLENINKIAHKKEYEFLINEINELI